MNNERYTVIEKKLDLIIARQEMIMWQIGIAVRPKPESGISTKGNESQGKHECNSSD